MPRGPGSTCAGSAWHGVNFLRSSLVSDLWAKPPEQRPVGKGRGRLPHAARGAAPSVRRTAGLWPAGGELLVLHRLALFYFISGFSSVAYNAGGWAAAWGQAACPLTPSTATAGSLPGPVPAATVATKRTSKNSALEACAEQVHGRENRVLFSQVYRFLVTVHEDQSQLKCQRSALRLRYSCKICFVLHQKEQEKLPRTRSAALLSAALLIERKHFSGQRRP